MAAAKKADRPAYRDPRRKEASCCEDRKWARRCGVECLPLGAIVCTAMLTGAYLLAETRLGQVRIALHLGHLPMIGGLPIWQFPADVFGDYDVGRWAWALASIERLPVPIPARGAQRFWRWRRVAADA